MTQKDMRMPVGMDSNGLAHALRTDSVGRLEMVFASGVGIHKRMLIIPMNGDLEAASCPLPFPNATEALLYIERVFLAVDAAPTGAAVIVDVNIEGASIFNAGDRPQIAAGATTGYSNTIASATWGIDELLTVDIDQVGSTTPGSDLTITIVVT